MKIKYLVKSFAITMVIFLSLLNFSYAINDNNVSLELLSNKQIYQVGENVNLTLKISNLNENMLQGQIKGKVIIGDVGYEIQCFDYSAPGNQTQYLGLTPLPASLSNSNRKTMTTLYACGGTRMQSSKTMMDNSPLAQNGQETFELGPFTYSYTLNGTDYDAKSNLLNITVVTSQNQNKQNNQQQSNGGKNEGSNKQSSQSQSQSKNTQSSQNPNSQQNGEGQSRQNTQNSQTQNGKSLSQQGQQALTNNQQNAQSVNQLKQNIANAKANPLNTNVQTEEKKSFWLWFFILLIVLLASLLVYFKYHRKEEPKEEPVIVKEKTPKYIKLLNVVNSVQDEKEKAKLLSQAIKTYIAEKNNLDIDLTHSKAIELTQSKLFQGILKKTEEIEFTGKKVKLDYETLVKNVRKEFEK